MPTDVDLKIGLNMEIGSVPLSLSVEVDSSSTVYTFDGCAQDAVIPLADFMAFVGQQFGVDVQLPPELGLKAGIDYLAGQVIHTSQPEGSTEPSTELGAAGRFVLGFADGEVYAFTFYADVVTGSGAKSVPYVVGAAVDLDLELAKLPLVGTIPGFKDLVLRHVGFSYTNNDPGESGTPVAFHIPQVSQSPNPLYTRGDPDARNAWSYAITSDGDQQKLSLDTKGFSLTAAFANRATGEALQGFALPLALPPTTPPATNAPPAPYAPGTTSPAASPVHWVDVNRTFGPVDLQKIGLNYAAGEATFGVTATFTLDGFSLGLQGLTATFPLPLPGQAAGKTVAFDLQGLTLDITTSSFELGGAFLKDTTGGADAYYGEVMVKAGEVSLKAIGGYKPAHATNDEVTPASFFLYANVDVPLGGPPYLYVTGLAGGFGVNDALVLPTLDGLPGYILLPGKAPPVEETAKATVEAVLPKLRDVVQPQPGEYWVAAGVQFTSFEMINAFALVTVSFGVDLQVGVLGSCSMTFPTGTDSPVAYVEIGLLASFSPRTGLLAVSGALSPASYLFGPFCRLTGGFAFYVWFGGEHEGEFVVTLGGYNPAFVPPPHYPVVPRLGASFSLGCLQVVGGVYYALTPSMFMAGASLTATWEAPSVRAWFTLGADFLIAWAPFHYEANVYASIGCSVDVGLVTLNLHAGADLHLWGPPFGGKAVVDLDVVSFTIYFGAEPVPPPPVGWASFKSGFLPADTPARLPARAAAPGALRPLTTAQSTGTNVVKATVSRGLLGSDVDGQQWVVDPEDFQIRVSSTIPANASQWAAGAGKALPIPNDPAQYGTAGDAGGAPFLVLAKGEEPFDAAHVWNPTLAVRPMGKDALTSTLTLTLLRRGGDGSYDEYVTAVQAQPVTGNVPAALWMTAPGVPAPNDPAFVETALTGFVLSPIPRNPDRVNAVPLDQLVFQQGNTARFRYTAQAVDTAYTVSATFPTPREMDITVSGSHTAALQNHDFLLQSLVDPWVVGQRAGILAGLNAAGFSTHTPAEVDLAVMANQKALTDWPGVLLLGADLS